MIIGVPKEVKNHEYRVGMIPAGVRELSKAGHRVLVQAGAGGGSGITDAEYVEAGAQIIGNAEEVWGGAEMIVKVKEPVPDEYDFIQDEQVIYTYFHLAAVPQLAEVLLAKRVAAVAYETVQRRDGSLPLLQPMSEVAGKMATQVAAMCLQKEYGGKGLLLGGVPGVRRANFVVIGGGTVGKNAAKVAVGMGANVTILDVTTPRLNYLDDVFLGRVQTMFSDADNLKRVCEAADVVIGAVLVAGARAPKLLARESLSVMENGSVLIDVAVDQGGCIETCRPTTHEDPTYVIDGIVHYCVANMPGAVAQTSTFALNNVTRPYAMAIANKGVRGACAADPELGLGLNTLDGNCTHEAVAHSLGYPYTPPVL